MNSDDGEQGDCGDNGGVSVNYVLVKSSRLLYVFLEHASCLLLAIHWHQKHKQL